MRLLVIGARGYLGAHVRSRARAAGLDVITAGRKSLPGSPCHQCVDLAECDPAAIAAMIDRLAPDAVANCAGATAGSPCALAGANVTGTFALVRALLLAADPPRLVHLGSAAEYGRGEPGEPVGEHAIPRPVALYGATKLAGTKMVELAAVAGLDAAVLRVFNPVGPGAPESSLPGRLAAELRRADGMDQRDGDVRLGALDAVRDFVDARDVADAVLAAVTAPDLPHRVLNIGSGRGVPVRALVKELVAISGHRVQVREDLPAGPQRSADVPWQQADISRAGRDLGWAPRRDLTTSLTDLWKACR
jgi:nucleoside-diphosphate-sugar epimerase